MIGKFWSRFAPESGSSGSLERRLRLRRRLSEVDAQPRVGEHDVASDRVAGEGPVGDLDAAAAPNGSVPFHGDDVALAVRDAAHGVVRPEMLMPSSEFPSGKSPVGSAPMTLP
jgi:hypothetical protein